MVRGAVNIRHWKTTFAKQLQEKENFLASASVSYRLYFFLQLKVKIITATKEHTLLQKPLFPGYKDYEKRNWVLPIATIDEATRLELSFTCIQLRK